MFLHLINLVNKYIDIGSTFYKFVHPYLNTNDYFQVIKDILIVIPYNIFILAMLFHLTYEYAYGYYEYYFPLYSL